MTKLNLLRLEKTVVDLACEAIRDADWKANTYGIPYAVTDADEAYSVKALSVCNHSSEILEILGSGSKSCLYNGVQEVEEGYLDG